MPAHRLRKLVPAVACAATAMAPSAANAQGSDACRPDRTPRLRCPDLVLRTPYDRYFERVRGRIRYHAANSIVNQGQGPAELFAQRRTASGPMCSSATAPACARTLTCSRAGRGLGGSSPT